MAMKSKFYTRREFLKGTTSAAVAGTLYMGSASSLLASGEQKKTRVVLIRNRDVLDSNNKINAGVIQDMLDRAVTTALNIDDAGKAWKSIIRPDDVVGIKTNVWNYLPTPPELEQGIKKRVMECGVPEDRISIRDRGLLSDDVFTKSTALINTRPMRTHYWAGVGSLIKNYIMFVDNPSAWHPDTCADLGKLLELPMVKGKTRLNILVMMTPLFNGSGPHHFNPQYTWPYGGLIVGTDMVACDAVGVTIIQNKRREYFGEDSPINPPPKHIFLADTRPGQGTADLSKIDLVKLGDQEGVLI
jgi:hypothetical protein